MIDVFCGPDYAYTDMRYTTARNLVRRWAGTILPWIAVLAGLPAQATPTYRAVLDLTNGTASYSTQYSNATDGIRFSLSSSTEITGAWGMFDIGSDGLMNSHDVGLWSDDGVLLASVTVTNASTPVASAALLGRWMVADLPSPITLAPGTYRVAAFYRDMRLGEDGVVYNATLSGIAGASYVGWAYTNTSGTNLVFPNPQTPYFSTVLEFGGMAFAAGVPEPSTRRARGGRDAGNRPATAALSRLQIVRCAEASRAGKILARADQFGHLADVAQVMQCPFMKHRGQV